MGKKNKKNKGQQTMKVAAALPRKAPNEVITTLPGWASRKKPETIPTYRVEFSQKAWRAMWRFVDLAAPDEVSGLGLVERVGDFGLHVEEIFLLDQVSSAATTELDATDIANLQANLIGQDRAEDADSILLWWHSHGDMESFWSGTDVSTIEQLQAEPYLLSVVVNKKREYMARVDMWEPLRATIQASINQEIGFDEGEQDALDALFVEKYSFQPPVQASFAQSTYPSRGAFGSSGGVGYGYGRGYGSGYSTFDSADADWDLASLGTTTSIVGASSPSVAFSFEDDDWTPTPGTRKEAVDTADILFKTRNMSAAMAEVISTTLDSGLDSAVFDVGDLPNVGRAIARVLEEEDDPAKLEAYPGLSQVLITQVADYADEAQVDEGSEVLGWWALLTGTEVE